MALKMGSLGPERRPLGCPLARACQKHMCTHKVSDARACGHCGIAWLVRLGLQALQWLGRPQAGAGVRTLKKSSAVGVDQDEGEPSRRCKAYLRSKQTRSEYVHM